MLDQPNLDKIDHEHLLSLYGIMRAMNSSLEFEEVLNTVLDSMMAVTHAQRGFLMIADDQSGRLRVQVARTLDGNPAEESYSTTIVNEVVATRQPLLTNNAQFDTRYKVGQSIIMKGLRAILCAPMLVKDQLVGVVYVDTSIRTGSFKESDLFLLSAWRGRRQSPSRMPTLPGRHRERARWSVNCRWRARFRSRCCRAGCLRFPVTKFRRIGARRGKWRAISTMFSGCPTTRWAW